MLCMVCNVLHAVYIYTVCIKYNNVRMQFYVGDIRYDAINGSMIGAGYILFTYTFEGMDRDTKLGEKLYDAQYEMLESQSDFFTDSSVLKQYENEYDITFVTFTSRSFNDEFQRLARNDLKVFGAALIVMIIYLSLTLGSFDCVKARPIIAMAAIIDLVFSLSIGVSIGLFFVDFSAISLLVG